MTRRGFSSTYSPTTLVSSVATTDTTFTVAASTGAPATLPWTGVVDRGTSNEELVTVTAVSGTTYTVTRASDGQTAKAHASGAAFEHVVSARDFDEPNAHVNDTTLDQHTQYAKRGQGLASNVGAASRAGRLYIATDTEDLYADDGTTVHRYLSKPSADAAYQSLAGPQSATVAAAESTASATYTDLTTVGPNPTVTIGASGRALVIVGARVSNTTIGAANYMGVAVAGATTRAAADATAYIYHSPAAGQVNAASATFMFTGLTPGSNTFAARYKATAGTGTWQDRNLTVIPL